MKAMRQNVPHSVAGVILGISVGLLVYTIYLLEVHVEYTNIANQELLEQDYRFLRASGEATVSTKHVH